MGSRFVVQAAEQPAHPKSAPRRRPGISSHRCTQIGEQPYFYSSNSSGTGNLDNGEIYKMQLDGTIVGRFGKAGRLLKEFASTHALDCRFENTLYVGEILSWRVQKLTLRP